MNVLARPVVKAKLKIPGEVLVLADVMVLGKDAVTAPIGEFKADDLAARIFSVLPTFAA
jgi:hypothetical protein